MESELLLNRYILQDRLGGGSGGEVNLAWDTRMRRNVAIKRIPLPIYQQSDSIPGLEEARTAAKLSDQRIISVHDFEETGNEALLIMEFVDGISLGALMDTIPRLLTPDEIASIAQNVGKALQYAHNHNVLHLDVKPDNVMLDMSGQTKMTDFGLARLGQRSGFGVATGGTIGYMPPEQLSGGEVSEATDQWAFAMVIYELVTGSNPFIAPTFAESANLIASSDIYLPSSIREEFDEEFDEILFTALSIDPQERFASIGEFITELIPHLGNPKNGRARLKKLIPTLREPMILGSPQDRAEAMQQLAIARAFPNVDAGQISDDDGEFYNYEFEGGADDIIERGDDGEYIDAYGSEMVNPYDERIVKHSRKRGDDYGDEGTYDEPVYRRSLRERADDLRAGFERSGARIAGHLIGCLCSGVVGAIGVLNFGLDQQIINWAAIAVLAIVGGAFPRIGPGLSLLAVAAAMIINGWIAQGAILAILTIIWWLFLGRMGLSESNCAALAPSASVIGLGMLQPLMTGYMLPLRKTLLTSAFGVAIMLLLAPITGNSSIFSADFIMMENSSAAQLAVMDFYGSVTTWIVVGGWILSAICIALFSLNKGMVMSVLGAIVSSAIMVGIIAACAMLSAAFLPAMDWHLIVTIGIPMLIACFCIWLYVPEPPTDA